MCHGTNPLARKGGAAQHWGGEVKVGSNWLLASKLEVRDDGYETVSFIWSEVANWPSSSIEVFAATEFSKNPLGLTAVSGTLNTPTFQGLSFSPSSGRARLKRDGTRAETRFGVSEKWTSPFKSAGESVQSTTGSRGVRISG